MSWKTFASSLPKSIPDLQGFHITHLQSSDDSGILISVQLKDLTWPKWKWSWQNCESKHCLSPEKILCLIGVLVRVTRSPPLAHMPAFLSSTLIGMCRTQFWGQSSNIFWYHFSQQHRYGQKIVWHSSQTRGSLLKNGATIQLVSVAQTLQFFAHLDMFGLRLRTKIVDEYFHEMIKGTMIMINGWCPHPSLGFFPLEQEQICGHGGHRLALYNACNNSNLVKTNTLMIRAHEELAEDNIGALTPFQLRIYCGQIQKFQKFICWKTISMDLKSGTVLIRT